MRAYAKITTSVTDGVLTITLNVPERRNAIGPQMTNELLWALHDARAASDVRVVVITGAGKAFCAGGDFQQMSGGADAEALPPKGDYADLLLLLARFDKPVIAKVNGHAMGGGLGLVAAATFAVASSDAQLGTPEIQVGLFPMMIMAVLQRIVPRRRLLEMMLFGERLDADQAAAAGIINRAAEVQGHGASYAPKRRWPYIGVWHNGGWAATSADLALPPPIASAGCSGPDRVFFDAGSRMIM